MRKLGLLFSLVILISLTGCVRGSFSSTVMPIEEVAPKAFVWPTIIPSATRETLHPQVLPTSSLPGDTGARTPPLHVEHSLFPLRPAIYPVLSTSQSNELLAIDYQNGKLPVIYQLGSTPGIFSPDGKSFLYMEENYLWVNDLTTSQKQKIPQPENGAIANEWVGSWSPDGKRIVYGIRTIYFDQLGNVIGVDDFNNLYVADLERKTYYQITEWQTIETSPIWSPDGNWVAFLADHAKVSQLDGLWLGASDVYLIEVGCLRQESGCETITPIQLTNTGLAGSVSEIVWAPNSKHLALVYISAEGVRDIYTLSIAGQLLPITSSPETNEYDVAWSPKGNMLCFQVSTDAGGQITMLDLENKTQTQISDPEDAIASWPIWSPDGQYIAYNNNLPSTGENQILVYSVEDNQLIDLLPGNSARYSFDSWLTVLPEFSIGTEIRVSPLGEGLYVRSQPSVNGEVVAQLTSNDLIAIVDGPIFADNYRWWNIQVDGSIGWIAEVDLWVLPVEPFEILGP